MTALAEILTRRIDATGAISLSEYMAECLLHPEHGYYATRDPFGAAGDFTTAPEISQMFGEMLGLFLAQVWLDQGAPAPFTLAEPGPGRGTLMADILRATRGVPGFHDAAQVHLIEASETLRAVQRKRLQGHRVAWADSLANLPDAPLLLVANEFFDALPIRQFQRDLRGWREVQVTTRDGALAFALSQPAPIAALDHRLADTTPGDVVELCPAAAAIMAEIAARIGPHGGVALIIDYGDWRARGDTFQALERHAPVDPLANPGRADLTAHVDFGALAAAAPGLAAARLTAQGLFLDRLGIAHRARTLARALTGAALEAHVAAHRRLTHADEMGNLFKVLGLVRPGDPMLPGLEP